MPEFVKENSEFTGEDDSQVVTSVEPRREAELPVAGEQDSERKTLYDQYQENRARKQEEFSQILAARNSSYKLDEKSAAFYNSLKEQERLKELKEKEFERIELEKYRAQRATASANKVKKSEVIATTAAPTKSTVTLPQATTTKVTARISEAAAANIPNSTISIKKKSPLQISHATPDKERATESPKPATSALPGIHDYSSSSEDE